MKIKTVVLHYKKETPEISLVDITRQVEHSIVDSRMNDGIATIHTDCPAACITTMEYEPGSIKDLKDALEKFTPLNGHSKDDLHTTNGIHVTDIRPSIIGSSITVPFKDNREMLGKWQKVVLIDFGKSIEEKRVIVQIMGE